MLKEGRLSIYLLKAVGNTLKAADEEARSVIVAGLKTEVILQLVIGQSRADILRCSRELESRTSAAMMAPVLVDGRFAALCDHLRRMSETSNGTAVERCEVVIIGAGASGLYCAHLLAKTSPHMNVVVLEARDRIGGRIHTVEQELSTVESDKRVVVAIDYGAAWVHGTGHDWKHDENEHDDPLPESNPMMELLTEAKGMTELHQNHLKPVCKKGNPWVRPRYVLHQENDIVLFMAGKRLDKDDVVIQKAISRHFEILQKVSDYGNQMYEEGRGIETIHQSLQDTIDIVKESLPMEQEQDSERVEALVQWYQYLMEAWYGGQASDMQLMEFTRDADEELAHDDVYCEEGDFYGPHCLLRDGMKTVLEPLLANGGAERVRCGQQVVRIQETSDNTVIVETRGGLLMEADCCVVTVPVGCLKDAVEYGALMFHPALSDEKVKVSSRSVLYEEHTVCSTHKIGDSHDACASYFHTLL